MPTFANIDYLKMNRLSDDDLAHANKTLTPPQTNDYLAAEIAFDHYYSHVKISTLVDRIVEKFAEKIAKQMSSNGCVVVTSMKN